MKRLVFTLACASMLLHVLSPARGLGQATRSHVADRAPEANTTKTTKTTKTETPKPAHGASSAHCDHDHGGGDASHSLAIRSSSTSVVPTRLHRESVYQLRDALVDQDGSRIQLDHYRGHPVLIAMFYATCRKVCPVILAKVKSLDASLPPKVKQQTRVLLVSFDQARDKPAVLRSLSATHGLDASRTTLVTTSDAGVRKIAAVLGVQYRRLADGEYDHSAVIALLDREGRVAYRLQGLNQDPAPLKQAVIGVAQSAPLPGAREAAPLPGAREAAPSQSSSSRSQQGGK